ncbi:MAG TPA: magnesium/cobalt transporter CorA [Rhizomicrobium sp.]|nr:magnesium/cobalt transporter CorA [Rhizomicrobium sp.]
MLRTFQPQDGVLKPASVAEDGNIPEAALWLDLLDPTAGERRMVDRFLGMELPTRADMEEIEVSSRLYEEGGGVFMTALLLNNADTDRFGADVVTFVLAHDRLVTIRYIDPQPFRTFAARCERTPLHSARAETVLLNLVDVIIDRMADVLERIGADVEAVSNEVFNPDPGRTIGAKDFQNVLSRLGRKHGLTSKMRESLLSLGRVLTFLTQATEGRASKDVKAHIKTLTRDVQSLQDHSSFIAGKLSYLQDGTLGLINNEQNNIIKIMSVAAIVFLPPTLIASIYGMNFKFLPELDLPWGYFYSLALMIVSGVVPYFWFKRRGWL